MVGDPWRPRRGYKRAGGQRLAECLVKESGMECRSMRCRCDAVGPT